MGKILYEWVKASDELPSIEQVRKNSAVMIIKIDGFNATSMYDYKTGRFWTTNLKELHRGGTITYKNEEIEWLKEVQPSLKEDESINFVEWIGEYGFYQDKHTAHNKGAWFTFSGDSVANSTKELYQQYLLRNHKIN